MFNSTLNRIQRTGLEVIDVRANVLVDNLCSSLWRLCLYCSPMGHTPRALTMRPWQLKPATAAALPLREQQAAVTTAPSIASAR